MTNGAVGLRGIFHLRGAAQGGARSSKPALGAHRNVFSLSARWRERSSAPQKIESALVGSGGGTGGSCLWLPRAVSYQRRGLADQRRWSPSPQRSRLRPDHLRERSAPLFVFHILRALGDSQAASAVPSRV